MYATTNPTVYSFSELLRGGDIPRAMQLRLESLEDAARHYRQELEAAKCSAFAFAGVGVVLSVSPAVAILAAVGLGSYAYTLARDYQYTKRFCPMPLVRRGLGDLLMGVGVAADGDSLEEDPLIDTIGYLSPPLAHEYEFISVSEQQIAGYLLSVPADDRVLAYQYLLRNTRIRGKLKVPAAPVTVTATTVGQAIAPPLPQENYDDEPITTTNAMTKTVSPLKNKITVGTSSVQVWQPEQFVLIPEMGNRIANTLIVGIPGAGKGIVVSNAVRSVREQHPQKTIMWVDPKNDPQESGYFAVDGVLARRASIRQMNSVEVFDWLRSCIEEFEALPGEKLLVLDEAVMIIAVLKTIKDAMDWLKIYLVGLITTGDSQGQNCWIVAQSPYLDDLGIGGGIASQMTRIALVSSKNVAALGALLRTSFIPNIAKVGDNVLQDLMNKSPVDRCYYHGGKNKWYSMERLENYSTIDRDTRRTINVQVQEADPFCND